MAKIAALVGPLFEDVEYERPAHAFKQAGHQVVNVSIAAREEMKGERGKATVMTDAAARDVAAADFDALFIPGGCSPDKLRVDGDVVKFARDFVIEQRLTIDNSGSPGLSQSQSKNGEGVPSVVRRVGLREENGQRWASPKGLPAFGLQLWKFCLT